MRSAVALPLVAHADTVRVTASRIFDRDRNGFAQRRRMGFGTFRDRAWTERRPAIFTSDLFTGINSVSITPGSTGAGRHVRMRGTATGYCDPVLFIDGLRMPAEMGVDELVTFQMVDQIEVYTRRLQAPPQYQALHDCGSIVIWTKRGESRPEVPPKEPR